MEAPLDLDDAYCRNEEASPLAVAPRYQRDKQALQDGGSGVTGQVELTLEHGRRRGEPHGARR